MPRRRRQPSGSPMFRRGTLAMPGDDELAGQAFGEESGAVAELVVRVDKLLFVEPFPGVVCRYLAHRRAARASRSCAT